MSVAKRQSELKSAEIWSRFYEAYRQVNFRAYDYDSIRAALIGYLQSAYPEDFNDYTDNAEAMFLVDMLAYVSQMLAYRVEINARENFLDTAERRESVLRLVRFLGYSPARNIPASGFLKVTAVRTDLPIRDSRGIDISNRNILWNEVSNPNWREHFNLILNSAFVPTNPIGRPIKTGSVGGIPTEVYAINSRAEFSVERFSASVAGETMSFEVVPVDFDSNGLLYEIPPSEYHQRRILYFNDGAGLSSKNTGFFVHFKQGTLREEFLQIEPKENIEIVSGSGGVNNTDVWVQRIDPETRRVLEFWSAVQSIESLVNNSLAPTQRRVFSVRTIDDERVVFRFGDGRIAAVPEGFFKFVYRVSNGLRYYINPRDIENVPVNFRFFRNNNVGEIQEYTLTLFLSLMQPVSNSSPPETLEQMRRNAPYVYYTQNRMVSAEDYNNFPLSRGSEILKVSSINRTYSGHSPFIDLNDPTRRDQSTVEFGDDGVLYQKIYVTRDTEPLPTDKNSFQIYQTKIEPLLRDLAFRHFFWEVVPRFSFPVGATWQAGESLPTEGTGRIFVSGNPIAVGPGGNPSSGAFYVRRDAFVKFVNPLDANDYRWARVVSVLGNGTTVIPVINQGAIKIDERIPNGWLVSQVIPAFRDDLHISEEVKPITDHLTDRKAFGLRYDHVLHKWKIIEEQDMAFDSEYSALNAGNQSGQSLDASWLVSAQYFPSGWIFRSRRLSYIFESVKVSRFYIANSQRNIDVDLSEVGTDYIKILRFNQKYNGSPFDREYAFAAFSNLYNDDGSIQPRRVELSLTDADRDGTPDDLDAFSLVVERNPNNIHRYVHVRRYVDRFGYEYRAVDPDIIPISSTSDLPDPQQIKQVGLTYFVPSEGITWRLSNNGQNFFWEDVSESYQTQAFEGRARLNYKWRHFAPQNHRIDPAITNIVDMYILTDGYMREVERWKRSGNYSLKFPDPPSSAELRRQFIQFDRTKMVSDSIVFHPARFRILFGEGADPNMRATLRVVKSFGSNISDQEIKRRVVDAVNRFFDVENWMFGDKFYATELYAFIHRRLASDIASVVLVPVHEEKTFGDLHEISFDFDELPLSTLGVNDVEIVPALTQTTLRQSSNF